MPKKWRRDERRKIAQEEAARRKRHESPEAHSGHPSWDALVAGVGSNEDTTIATSRTINIAAGTSLELPLQVETDTAIVHYAFKVNDMDIDLSAACTALSTNPGKTGPAKVLLPTTSLDATTGWFRGMFKPGMRCTCTFQLSNDYSFFNSKDVLFEIKVRDDVHLTKQWNVKMDLFHDLLHQMHVVREGIERRRRRTATATATTTAAETKDTKDTNEHQAGTVRLNDLLQRLKAVQIDLEDMVCHPNSTCLTPDTRSEIFFTRSKLGLETYKTSLLSASSAAACVDVVLMYLYNVHFMPCHHSDW